VFNRDLGADGRKVSQNTWISLQKYIDLFAEGIQKEKCQLQLDARDVCVRVGDSMFVCGRKSSRYVCGRKSGETIENVIQGGEDS